ncbi:MAG: hypothetical protein SF069_03020 [Phycisphaerae bacterium]|nr:hypothetical protein [Phycisphaerae bacterium]
MSASVQEQLTRIDDKLDVMTSSISDVSHGLTALRAQFDELRDRQRAEIEVLFESKNGHETRLGSIERTYWPREDQRRFEDSIMAKMVSIGSEVKAIRTQNLMWMGGAIVVAWVVANFSSLSGAMKAVSQ